jgi:hypothetical protein
MLKEIYDFIESHSKDEVKRIFGRVFAPSAGLATDGESPKKWNELGLPVGTICIVNKRRVATNIFANVDEAAKWLIKEKMDGQKNDIIVENIKARILKSCYSKPYCGIKWVVVQEVKE